MDYQNQQVLLASKHRKERAMAAPFFNRLSCTLSVRNFDTDQFGTFTGEITRKLNAYETCLLKAKTAAQQFGFRLVVASEGSFGPHPAIPFAPCDHELMVFVDTKHDWIIAEQIRSLKTNYAMLTMDKGTEISTFLERVKFPSHALILQANSDKRLIAKGIKDLDSLNKYLEIGFEKEETLLLGTDMRAMMNPSRMEVLGELADKLAVRIATLCPACHVPGFGFKTTHGALPCRHCTIPTTFYQKEIWGCIQCKYQEHKMRQDGLLEADPTYCDFCNP